MKQLFQCLVDDTFNVTGMVQDDRKALRSAKLCEISLELRQVDSDHVIVSKVLPWPTGEEFPSKAIFDRKEEVLSVMNGTTLAKIPFRTRVLKSLVQQHDKHTPIVPRIVSSFDETESKTKDGKVHESLKTVQILRDVIDDPQSDIKWKKMKKAIISSAKSELSSLLTVTEQTKLLAVLKNRINTGDKDMQNVLKFLLECDVFGYKMTDEVHLLCESSSFDSLVSELIISNRHALPEKTFVRALKKAAGSDETSMKTFLKTLLELPFEDKQTAAAASDLLSPSEAATLIGCLMEMYKDDEERNIHGKILSLVALLFDSHSTQFLSDSTTHDTILEAASFISAMTSLTGTFAELECTDAARRTISSKNPVKPDFLIHTVHLKVRKWTQIQPEEKEKGEIRSMDSDDSDTD
ncbi:hypothetical protein PFISCL1PPCAC_24912 [Pristionchus fissidentatus]|uniref:Uncharacterized protein n=1 Tax=Pristionchus fissidentatus TaxID=1538716 RepID=A0AAV5WSS6_9BILA|nr:hypothetical protein PFISCL1PPCAC_24912 [Pristionchus fissidentatus]